jgi:exodeoxyribonuclease V beta subunit
MLEGNAVQIFDEDSKEMRRVKPGDIAILVSKNRDAEMIKSELKKIGLSAVTYSREKVLESFEAVRVKLMMESVLDPMNSSKVGNLLVSGFFGFDGDHLHSSIDDDGFLTHLQGVLTELNEIWFVQGFYAMMRHLLFEQESLHHFSTQPDSERVLTNLFHLADICAKAEQEKALSMGELYHWFLNEMKRAEDDDEKTQLLESDQKLIKILTVHTSKGLEFPVVFCPFLWEGTRKEKGDEFNEYHDNKNRLKINVDFRKEANADVVRKSRLESVSEEVRKAYVAITRAKYQCRIVWGSHTESHLSGLGGVFLGKKFIEKEIDNKLGDKDQHIKPTIFIDKIAAIQLEHGEYISLNKISQYQKRTETVKLPDQNETAAAFKPYSGPEQIQPGKRLDSFSSLSSHGGDVSQPDYDQTLESYVSFLESRSVQNRVKNIFSFPKGATAGTAIHKLFEHEKFEFATASQNNLIPIAEEVLEQYNYNKEWSGVLQTMMRDVAGAKINDLDLSSVERSDEIREMEFHFPTSDPDMGEILNIIRKDSSSKINEKSVQNYLTGFIDLTVRQNSKYYILDYKSNYMGDRIEDYEPEKLRKEIESAHYDMQYHIYTVALKKYLTARIPDFDYERDFGGVGYLFVRGMRKGSDNGVWWVKPSQKVINRLEEYLTATAKISEAQR